MITNNNFPSDKEIEKITKKVSASNYPYKNYILPSNASSTSSAEKAKYELCQDILKYQQENNLSETKLTKMLGVNKDKLIDILF
ncbi:10840_t:CDS:1, partial [Funneliformis geosporum]